MHGIVKSLPGAPVQSAAEKQVADSNEAPAAEAASTLAAMRNEEERLLETRTSILGRNLATLRIVLAIATLVLLLDTRLPHTVGTVSTDC